jgi:hypothetical protein
MDRPVVSGFHSLFQRFGAFAILQVARDNRRAVAGQERHGRAAQAACATRYEHYAAVERSSIKIQIKLAVDS